MSIIVAGSHILDHSIATARLLVGKSPMLAFFRARLNFHLAPLENISRDRDLYSCGVRSP